MVLPDFSIAPFAGEVIAAHPGTGVGGAGVLPFLLQELIANTKMHRARSSLLLSIRLVLDFQNTVFITITYVWQPLFFIVRLSSKKQDK
jgi:hypothetical protein